MPLACDLQTETDLIVKQELGSFPHNTGIKCIVPCLPLVLVPVFSGRPKHFGLVSDTVHELNVEQMPGSDDSSIKIS